MQNHPPQFKADAVELYRSRPEAVINSVAADLGISSSTLRPSPRTSRPFQHATALTGIGQALCMMDQAEAALKAHTECPSGYATLDVRKRKPRCSEWGFTTPCGILHHRWS